MDFCEDLEDDDEEEEEEANDDKVDLNNQKDMNPENGQATGNETQNQIENKNILKVIREETGSVIIPAETAIELHTQFAKKEYACRVKSK